MEDFDIFGNTCPEKMPPHFFSGARRINYPTAVRASVEAQDYSICPRHWYVDAVFICEACQKEFTWTVAEQRVWFEEYCFWVDSLPKHCLACRRQRRYLTQLRKEYDEILAAARSGSDVKLKQRVIELVDCLESSAGKIPDRMRAARGVCKRQLKNSAEAGRT
ncbi:MAG: zinc-ribbon domain containing protein [Candidatus Omnitrophica bacterium]|nr:zinc-ribbon domain containing protein [Candidatus Omnitrophota bacterium]